MDNILLIFLNDLEDVDGFNEIIDRFAENNYAMYLIDNIKEDETFSMDLLPGYVEFYKKQHKSVNKVAILSNSRDLLFSWYRCFNTLVDDFIYFVDKDDKNYFNTSDRHFDFYFNLYEFNGIDEETINGKIYLSAFNTILLPIYFDLSYFDNFINYKFMEKSPNKSLNKDYKYNGLEFKFISNEAWEVQKLNIGKINKRIVFIKGQSQYDALRVGIDYKMIIYKKLGFEVDILDLLVDGSETIADKLITRKTDFVYSSNCIGIDMKVSDGRNLYDALNIPFYGRLGDHPVNQLSRIVNSNKMAQFTCLDAENISYFKKYFPNKNIIIEQRLGTLSKNYKEKNFEDRKIDMLFAGTIINPIDIEKSWKNVDDKSKRIIHNIIDYIISSGKAIDIDDEISRAFGNEMIINKSIKYRANIHSYIEAYIRYYKRYELVKKLGESGLEVLCIGNVDEYNKINKSKKLILRDKVTNQELLDLYNDTKILINMTGHVYDGVTERILFGMINGAAVVTERDNFTNKNFINKKNIILYDLSTVSDTLNDIKLHLKDLEKLKEIARQGQDLVRNRFNYEESELKTYRIMREFEFEVD